MAEIDHVSAKRIETLHPSIRFEVKTKFEVLAAKGIIVRLIEGLRTYETQAAYYAQGRQPVDAVNGLRKIAGLPPITAVQNVKNTNSIPGLSFHQYGLGFDFCILLNNGKEISFNEKMDYNHDCFSDWMQIVNEFTAIGWTWGGSFGDNDHLEKHCGKNIMQLKTLHDSGKVDSNKYVLL